MKNRLLIFLIGMVVTAAVLGCGSGDKVTPPSKAVNANPNVKGQGSPKAP
jgi:hypothetical protein